MRPTEPAAGNAALAPAPTAAPGLATQPLADCICPHCGHRYERLPAAPLETVSCAACNRAFLVPSRFDGFTIVEHIGEGEMGKIYRATDESLHRDVAIKLIRGANDNASRERLRQEARAAAKLSHPHVAHVYALGFAHGQPYIVMELVRGEDLDVRLQREGRLDEYTVLRIALDIADGLYALHRNGQVHGDIKPANIVLGKDGRAKLVDFGLSGMVRRAPDGRIIGTPHYIAPELLKGAPDSTRTDIYSLGATLYHALAGQAPFGGATTEEVAKARLHAPAPSIGVCAPHLTLRTQRLVMRMLESDPALRHQDCRAAVNDIRAALKVFGGSGADMRQEAATLATALPAPAPAAAPVDAPSSSGKWRMAVVIVLGTVAAIEIIVGIRAYCPQWPFGEAGGAPAVAAVPPASLKSGPPSPTPGPENAPPFFRIVHPEWTSTDLGRVATRGSTVWTAGQLLVQGEGHDTAEGQDGCRFVHARVEGAYAFSVRVTGLARSDPQALTGILARLRIASGGPSVFFGFLGDGSLLMQTRRLGREEVCVQRADAPLEGWQPCHLRLERRGNNFHGFVSPDGTNWQSFAACMVPFPDAGEIGVAMATHVRGARVTAEFAELRLLRPADATAR